ncbi:MAG: hypothetical protein JST00_13625 [Deltaproteobacteria bacterium]|nr:hypothetical protein [Deltaproteobacteria bacterium]
MNISRLGRSALVSIVVAALFATVACSSSGGAADGPCNGTRQCTCTDDCKQACDPSTPGGCQYTCSPGKTCTFDCPAGGCQMTCAENAVCNVGCSGGNCRVTGASSSTVDVACGNKGNCVVGCQAAKKCTVDGKDPNNPAGAGTSGGTGVPGTSSGGTSSGGTSSGGEDE